MWQVFVNVLEYFQPRKEEEIIKNAAEETENVVIPALEKEEETHIKEKEQPPDVEKSSIPEKETSPIAEKEEVVTIDLEESEEQNKKAQTDECPSAPVEGMDISPHDNAEFIFPEKTGTGSGKKTCNFNISL